MKTLYIADVKSFNVEGKSQGHYFSIAKNYNDIFKGLYKVYVAGGPLYQDKFNNVYLLKYDTFKKTSFILSKLRILRNLYDLFRGKESGDIVVLQSSAVSTAFIGILLFKSFKCKLYLIVYSDENLNSSLKRILYSFSKRKIDGILCPSENVGKLYKRPYCVVPDYVYTATMKYSYVSFENKLYDFTAVGIICRDKGIIEFAKKMKHTRYKILIAGMPQNKDIEEEIISVCADAENIQLNLGYLSEEEYSMSIINSKYCFLNYSGAYSEHSSGVVFDILFRNVPIIGTKTKFLSFIADYQLGFLYDSLENFDPETVLKKDVYIDYLNNIQKYHTLHKSYIDQIRNFIV